MLEMDDRRRDEHRGRIDREPPEFEGFIDAIEDGRVYGWAVDPGRPGHRVAVEIYHGRDLLGEATANRFRQDLVHYGDGSGRCAFVFNLPKELWARDPGAFYACFQGTSVPLMRGPRCSQLSGLDATGAVSEPTSETSSGTPDLDPLIARVEACERAMVTLVHLAHPRSELAREKTAQIEKLNAYIDRLSESINQVEEFVLRHDAKFKTTEAVLGRVQRDQQRRWYTRPEWWAMSLAAAAMAVTLLSAFLGWTPGGAP